eukprot:GHUV01042022.1.p1 GENE.GHUV01042022.1~~GHUV01042022.1.p1  ORF type:complete len:236 (+),score=22.71 GHUV01042022.1:38-745(+)
MQCASEWGRSCIQVVTAVCKALQTCCCSTHGCVERYEGRVMVLSLKNRLKQYQSVEADVSCDARGLLDGRFNALSIDGRHWVTPLKMTAHRLEVEIGTMQVDYGRLLTERKVSMKNIPAGSVRIHLSSKDMGNFLAHPMFQRAAETAVQGQPFHFDRDSVQIAHDSHGGQVHFTGTWAANGQRYRVLMLPGQAGLCGGRPQLQVGAQHICEGGNMTCKVPRLLPRALPTSSVPWP